MGVGQITLRILLAIVVGGSIGYEREMRNRPAGFITHTLVCVGATVVSLMQMEMVHQTILLIEANPVLAQSMKADLGRVVAQVVTGVGFLGAGTIIVDKRSVKGLTTATTIWVVACIGLTIGMGYYAIAIIATVSIFFVMITLRRFESMAKDRMYQVKLTVSYKDQEFLEELLQFIHKKKVQIRDIKTDTEPEKGLFQCKLILYFGMSQKRERFFEELVSYEEVVYIKRG
ncbi:MgtC/SapB family protein [Vallitaleaceae bacterium 9-2]